MATRYVSGYSGDGKLIFEITTKSDFLESCNIRAIRALT